MAGNRTESEKVSESIVIFHQIAQPDHNTDGGSTITANHAQETLSSFMQDERRLVIAIDHSKSLYSVDAQSNRQSSRFVIRQSDMTFICISQEVCCSLCARDEIPVFVNTVNNICQFTQGFDFNPAIRRI